MEYGQKFDEDNNIWFTPPKDFGYDFNQLVGVAILDRLKILDQNRVLEVNHGNGKETTVAEMRKLSITCAKNLEKLGLKKGDIVVFFSQLNYLTTPTCYGCFINGVIVNPMVVTMNEVDTDHVLGYLDPTMIIYDDIYKDKIEASLKRIKGKNLRFFLSTNSTSSESQENLLFQQIPDLNIDDFTPPNLGDPKKVILSLSLTSGSSGKPKAIEISHAFYLRGLAGWWEHYENMRFYIGSPFGWISQLSNITQPVFLSQTRIYSGLDPTPEYIAKLINDTGVTHMFCVTKKLSDIVDYCNANNKNQFLRSIKKIMSGGAPITETLKRDTLNAVPDCQFCSCYGMTEVASCISSDELLEEKLGMAILRGVQLKIVDDNLNALGVNKPGRILVKTEIEFLEYYHNDKANEESFIDGWLVTGDFGYMNEHNLLHVLGRYKDLIFCDKEMIIPSQVEALVNNHPAILQAAVVAAPHDDASKGSKAAVFFSLKSQFKNSSSDEIKSDIEKLLKTSWKWEQIHSLSVVETFQYLSTGKLDKKVLQAKFN